MPEILAQLPAPDGILSLPKTIAFLILLIPWLYGAPWVHRDARRVRTHQGLWSLVVLGAGVLGMLIWLLLPSFWLGLLAYAALTIASVVVYVILRNRRVEEHEKVFTVAHLSSLRLRSGGWKRTKPVTRVKLYGTDGKLVPEPDPANANPKDTEAYNLVQELLFNVFQRRASEADLSPAGQEMGLRYVIDGVVTQQPGMELAEGEAAIQYVKAVAGMDLEDHRLPQQGAVSIDMAGEAHDILVSTAGSTSGQRMQLRMVSEDIRQDINELGMTDQVRQGVLGMAAAHGLLIVAGPARNGVTSTLYSLLRAQDAFIKQLVTLEAKINLSLDNVTQRAYGQDAGLAKILAPAIRRDPDAIMIDRCPDAQCADLIAEAAAGRTVLLGASARDSFTALARWVQLCGDPRMAVENLRGILCQVLIRKLCPRCREAYRPDPQLLAKANLPAEKIEMFYRPPTGPTVDDRGRPVVCPACHGVGYLERTGAFELLEVTDEVRQLVAGGAALREIKAACRKSNMLYLQEQTLAKVIAGETSIQEVLRVSRQGKKKKKAKAAE